MAASVPQYASCAFTMVSLPGLPGHLVPIQRVRNGPARHDVRQARVDLRVARQRQRRVPRVPRPQSAEQHQVPAAGNAQRAHSGRAAELRGVHLEPANGEVHVAHRRGIASLGWLAEIDRDRQDALRGQRLIHLRVVQSVAVVPGTAVHVDDGRKRSCANRPVHACQPRLASQLLVFDVFDVYFEFDIRGHGRQSTPASKFRHLFSDQAKKGCSMWPKCTSRPRRATSRNWYRMAAVGA